MFKRCYLLAAVLCTTTAVAAVSADSAFTAVHAIQTKMDRYAEIESVAMGKEGYAYTLTPDTAPLKKPEQVAMRQ